MKRSITALLAIVSLGAQAGAETTASFNNITVELIDLDPNDGIAPNLTFRNTDWDYSYASVSTKTSDLVFRRDSTEYSLPPQDIIHSIISPPVSASIQLSGSSMETAAGIARVSWSSDITLTSGASQSTSKFLFSLTPNTQVNFSFLASIQSKSEGNTSSWPSWTQASVSLQSWTGGDIVGDALYYRSMGAKEWSFDSTKTLSHSFSNLANNPTYGKFEVGMHVLQQVSGVPEVSTWLMTASGLLLVGLLGRRRQLDAAA